MQAKPKCGISHNGIEHLQGFGFGGVLEPSTIDVKEREETVVYILNLTEHLL